MALCDRNPTIAKLRASGGAVGGRAGSCAAKWAKMGSGLAGEYPNGRNSKLNCLVTLMDYPAHTSGRELAMATRANRSKATRSAIARSSIAVLDDARRAGLLDGDRTEHAERAMN
jgi:hypothetical protein